VSGLAVVRDAHEDDLDAVMAMETSIFGTDAWPREMMRAEMTNPNCRYLVAELAHAPVVVAYAGLLCPPGSGDGDIQTIAVSPDMRGQGIGREMMTTLLAEAGLREATRVFLEVRADNESAQALYRDLGFIPVGVRAGYYQPDAVDAVTMRCDLGPSGRPGSQSPGDEMEGAC
jgi:ribosomal-protein-alanine acetyltransferase